MAVRFNGGIIGSRNLTTGGGIGFGTAVGIWSLNEAQIAKLAGIWPQEIPSGVLSGVQVFTESSSWVPPTGVSQVEYLIVAGGGGGDSWAGGGGAGGYRYGGGFPVTPVQSYTITIGAGGTGAIGTPQGIAGSKGSNSSFHTITSEGGGFGGGYNSGGNGGSGGSGGGASQPGASPVGGIANTIISQGFNGGNSAQGEAGAGGGGAGGKGQDAGPSSLGGNGGIALYSTISGANVGYAQVAELVDALVSGTSG